MKSIKSKGYEVHENKNNDVYLIIKKLEWNVMAD